MRSTSFAAARGVPAMLTHSIHLFYTKTEAVWREGCLHLSSNAANSHSSSPHVTAGDSFLNEIDLGSQHSKTQIDEGFYGKTKLDAESDAHLHLFPVKRTQT